MGAETAALQASGEGKGGRGAVLAPPGQARQTSRIKRPAIGQIIAYYAYMTTEQINQIRDLPGIPFWQRNYWHHVIRTEQALHAIRQSAADNPALRMWDAYIPTATGASSLAANLCDCFRKRQMNYSGWRVPCMRVALLVAHGQSLRTGTTCPADG